MKRAGSMLCPVILGRDDLLELMDHLIDEARQGRGRTLFLSGQAGLGKTRLLRAGIRKAEAAGLRVDGGAVAPQDHQVPLASIREMATGMRGNPAFGTLSQDLLAIDGRHDGDPLSDCARIREASVPDTIGDAVLARVDRLSADARTLARAGAVVGRCFTPEVIAGIVDRPFAELEPAIDELIDASILRPFDYIDKGYYDFRHQLLRDAIYETLPPTLLRRFHAQVAEFTMSLEASSIVHASRHYERAGLRAQAFRAALTAATDASRISARHEAFELYQRAIDNMPGDLPARERAEIHDRFSGAAAAIERNVESQDAATRARELYLEAGMPLEAAGMLIGMSIVAGREGSPDHGADRFADQALTEIEALP